MSDPIDLAAERNKRAQPDAEFVKQDDFGRKMFVFLLSYEMDGKQWGTQVWGYDFEDAAARVAGMRESLKVDGQLFQEVPL